MNLFQFITAVHYGMFYYLGAYLYERGTKLNIQKLIACLGLSVGSYLLSQILSNESMLVLKVIALFSDSFGSLAGVFAVYGIAILLGSGRGNNTAWSNLKRNSFGIYLFHQQLIYPCIMVLNGRVPPIVQVLLSFGIAILGAGFITGILRKIKITKALFGV